MKKNALITWASSGLGVDFAHQLAHSGYHCILVARSEDKLLAVQKDIQSAWGSTEIIVGDLSDQQFCTTMMQKLADKHISVLINNAGFGAHGDFEILDTDRQLNMIDLNCRSLTYLLQVVGQQMLKYNIHGYILNVASTAAFQPGPTMATYFATKAYVLSLTQAVRFERKDKYIHVAVLCPGATKTDFFNNSHNNPKSMMLQTMMESADVVKIGLEWLFSKKKIIIPWFMNKMLYYSGLWSPVDMVMRIVKKMME
jgi:short-subunit dehydrogenase